MTISTLENCTDGKLEHIYTHTHLPHSAYELPKVASMSVSEFPDSTCDHKPHRGTSDSDATFSQTLILQQQEFSNGNSSIKNSQNPNQTTFPRTPGRKP